MSNSLNSASIIGTLGRDPEIRAMNNGNRVCNLSVATNETWKDKNSGERIERVEWHRVVIWGDGLVGAIEQYLHKGSKVAIMNAKIQTRKWQDQSGADRYSTEIVVQGFGSQVIFLDPPKQRKESEQQSQSGGYEATGSQGGGVTGSDLNDDIPFSPNRLI